MNILEWLSNCYERYSAPPTEDELSAQADPQVVFGQHMFQCGVLVATELGLELYYRLRRQEDEATADRLRKSFHDRPEP